MAYCATASANTFQGCYLDGASAPAVIPAGSRITTDRVVPPKAIATTGLTSPDGILGVIPRWQVNPHLHIPRDATTCRYIDKKVGFFIPCNARVAACHTGRSAPLSPLAIRANAP